MKGNAGAIELQAARNHAHEQHGLRGYLLAALAAVLALFLRLLVDPWLGEAQPFATFYICVTLVAWKIGWRQALLSAGLGLILGIFFLLEPRFSFLLEDWQDRARVFTCIVVTGTTVLVFRQLRSVQRDLQRDQEAKEASLAQLEAIIGSMTDALIAADLQGNILTFNPAALALHGFNDLQQARRHFHEYPQIFEVRDLQGRIQPPGQWPLARALRGETFHNHELSVHRRDTGKHFIGNYSGTLVRNAAGHPLLAITTIREVTQQKQAEEALRESETRFRQLADAMPQIVWAARPDGCLDYYNRRWYELTGAAPGAHGDQSWLPVLHPHDRQKCLDTWYESVRTGNPYEIEYRFKFTETGEYRWFLGRALPVRDDAGNIIRWYGTSTDIHDFKCAQEALQLAKEELGNLNANLEFKVRKRTAALEASLHSIEEVLYTIAHDLRAPNRAMHGFAIILLEEYAGRLDAQGQDLLRRIAAAAERSDHLIRDLLFYGRLAHEEVPRERVNLSLPVHQALNLLCDEIHTHQARVQLAQAWPDVVANEALLTQVVRQLVSNALKFVPPGVTPRPRFKVEREARRVRLVLQDNGIGIPSEHWERIFEPFQQLHPREYPGTGMGLAVVRKAVERMGGQVAVHSATGRGSEFSVVLPAG